MTSEPGLGSVDEVVALADAYMDAGKYDSAREVVSRSLGNHPDDPVLLANYARAELALGNDWQAARSAHAALAGAPEDEFAMRIYALALFHLGRHHDALWMAWRTVTTHPNLPEPLRLYALILQKTRQLRSALTVIDQALRLDPGTPARTSGAVRSCMTWVAGRKRPARTARRCNWTRPTPPPSTIWQSIGWRATSWVAPCRASSAPRDTIRQLVTSLGETSGWCSERCSRA